MARQCGRCGHEKTRVIDSQYSAGSNTIRRRRACPACGYHYTTRESAERRGQEVVKRNGSIEPFDDQKLLKSLGLACSRLLSGDAILAVAETVKVLFREKPRVSSEELRAAVADQLRVLEPVAYIRYRLDECADPADMIVVVAGAIRGQVGS